MEEVVWSNCSKSFKSVGFVQKLIEVFLKLWFYAH